MPTNNKGALQPHWDNLIWGCPTPTRSAPESPWAALACVLKFNAETMGHALSHKAKGVAKEVQLSGIRGCLTDNSGEVGINNPLSTEAVDLVLVADQTRNHDVQKIGVALNGRKREEHAFFARFTDRALIEEIIS